VTSGNLDTDAVVAAIRRTLSVLPDPCDGGPSRQEPPVALVPRDPGLPPLDGLPDFLFEDDPLRIRRSAIHEAGHAAVALRLGLEVADARMWPLVEGPDGPMASDFACFVHGGDPAQRGKVAAAGLVAEILVWGGAVDWATSVDDLSHLYHLRRWQEMASWRYEAGAWLSWIGLRWFPGLGRIQPGWDDCVRIRDTLPDESIREAVESFPQILAIARLFSDNWSGGRRIVYGEEIRQAAGLEVVDAPVRPRFKPNLMR